MTPSRPYFIRAVYEWISANSLTPYVLVNATLTGVQVPQQYVKDGKIVLNISSEAVVGLDINNDWISFDARFSGMSHRVRLPIGSVNAIYANENGRGMFFDDKEYANVSTTSGGDDDGSGGGKSGGGKPKLKLVK